MKREETTGQWDGWAQALGLVGALCAHGLVVGALGAGSLVWMVGEQNAHLLWTIEGGALMQQQAGALALHLGCVMALWALVWGGIKAMGRPRTRRRVRLVRARAGTALVETLIVLTPFLLLTSGLAQLTINNIAGLLSHVATYQAGRVYWVWQHEIGDNSRYDMMRGETLNEMDVRERARVAAALVMTPVAPAFPISPAGSDRLTGASDVMVASFGGTGAAAGSGSLSASPSATDALSFSSALDADAFEVRAAHKLNFAYQVTRIDQLPTPNANESTVTVVYSHYQMFPWFRWIFGGQRSAPVSGYYSEYRRTYTMTSQIDYREP